MSDNARIKVTIDIPLQELGIRDKVGPTAIFLQKFLEKKLTKELRGKNIGTFQQQYRVTTVQVNFWVKSPRGITVDSSHPNCTYAVQYAIARTYELIREGWMMAAYQYSKNNRRNKNV